METSFLHNFLSKAKYWSGLKRETDETLQLSPTRADAREPRRGVNSPAPLAAVRLKEVLPPPKVIRVAWFLN